MPIHQTARNPLGPSSSVSVHTTEAVAPVEAVRATSEALTDTPQNDHFTATTSSLASETPFTHVSSAISTSLSPIMTQVNNATLNIQETALKQEIIMFIEAILGFSLPKTGAGERLDLLSQKQLMALIKNGHLSLDLHLRNESIIKIPIDKGQILEVAIPKNEQSLIAQMDISMQRQQDDSSEDSFLNIEEFKLSFKNRAPNSPIHLNEFVKPKNYPSILNPSALEPSNSNSMDALKNIAADIEFRGFTINSKGEIEFDADVQILKFFKQDFQELAADSLPILETNLDKITAGNFISVAAKNNTDETNISETLQNYEEQQKKIPSLTVADLVKSFESAALIAKWKGTLSLEKPLEEEILLKGRMQTDFSGNVIGQNSIKLLNRQQTLIDLSTMTVFSSVKPDGLVDMQLLVNSTENVTDTTNIPLELKWNEQGMHIKNLDITQIFPLKLDIQGKKAPNIGTIEFQQRIAKYLNKKSPVHNSDSVAYIRDGNVLLKERLQLIRSSQKDDQLLLQTYMFSSDNTGQQIIDALINAHNRGVQVRVLIDSMGSSQTADEFLAGNQSYLQLSKAGVPILSYNNASAFINLLKTLVHNIVNQDDLKKHLSEQDLELLNQVLKVFKHSSNTELIDFPLLIVPLLSFLWRKKGTLKKFLLAKNSEKLHKFLEKYESIFLNFTKLDHLSFDAQNSMELVKGLGRDHRKMMLYYPHDDASDTKATILIGGNNIADSYQSEPTTETETKNLSSFWNDAHLKITGDSFLKQAIQDFKTSWELNQDEQNKSTIDINTNFNTPTVDDVETIKHPLRLVQHTPISVSSLEEGDNHFTNVMLAVFEGAGEGDRIGIENPYFTPIPELQEAIFKAAERGAEITIISNGMHPKSDAQLTSEYARQFIYPKLLESDHIQIFEAREHVQAIHKKTVVVRSKNGQQMYLIGSQNFDRLSAGVNKEDFILGGSLLVEPSQINTTKEQESIDSIAEELWLDIENDSKSQYSDLLTYRKLNAFNKKSFLSSYLHSLIHTLF